jgi:hypothetical protein
VDQDFSPAAIDVSNCGFEGFNFIEELIYFYLFISSYSHATVRLWRRLH